MGLTVTHRFVSAKPDSADLTLVNPTNWNDTHIIVGTGGEVNSDDYDWTPQLTGNLTAGITNTISLTPVPAGVNGTNSKFYVWLTGGTGAAEAVLVTGGSASSRGTTGTLSFVPANNHTGAVTVGPATQGAAEASWDLGPHGGVIQLPAGIVSFKAPWKARAIPIWLRGQGKDSTIIQIDSTYWNIADATFKAAVVYDQVTGYTDAGEISDLSFDFVQPDVTTPASMTHYQPAIHFENGSHLRIREVNIAKAYFPAIKIVQVNGVAIKSVGISNFMGRTIDIDNCYDRSFLDDIIVWPYGCTTNQATAFLATTNRIIPFWVGHVDAFRMSGCVTNVQGGYTADFHIGLDGYGPTGSITDCWFDGIGNMVLAAGSISMENTYQLVYDAFNSIAGLHINNADVKLSNIIQLALGPLGTIPIKFVPTTDTIATPALGLPNLQAVNCKAQMYNANIQWVLGQSQAGTTKKVKAKFSNCIIERISGGAYTIPTFQQAVSLGTGDIIFSIQACDHSDQDTGTSVFAEFATDLRHSVQCCDGGGGSIINMPAVSATGRQTARRNNLGFSDNVHEWSN